jgi:hypothetical protein
MYFSGTQYHLKEISWWRNVFFGGMRKMLGRKF